MCGWNIVELETFAKYLYPAYASSKLSEFIHPPTTTLAGAYFKATENGRFGAVCPLVTFGSLLDSGSCNDAYFMSLLESKSEDGHILAKLLEPLKFFFL